MDTTIVAAIIAIIPSLVLIFAQARNRKIDRVRIVSDAYHNLACDLRDEINRLSEKIDGIEKEREGELGELGSLRTLTDNLKTVLEAYVKVEGDLRKGVVILRKQVIELGGEPKYKLPPEIDFEIIEE